jgi:hypothetical protein
MQPRTPVREEAGGGGPMNPDARTLHFRTVVGRPAA